MSTPRAASAGSSRTAIPGGSPRPSTTSPSGVVCTDCGIRSVQPLASVSVRGLLDVPNVVSPTTTAVGSTRIIITKSSVALWPSRSVSTATGPAKRRPAGDSRISSAARNSPCPRPPRKRAIRYGRSRSAKRDAIPRAFPSFPPPLARTSTTTARTSASPASASSTSPPQPLPSNDAMRRYPSAGVVRATAGSIPAAATSRRA